MIKLLELKNFTAFKDLTIEFSPKINVIIGENGTGKTHLLKAAYALCSSAKLNQGDMEPTAFALRQHLGDKLVRLFMPQDNKLGSLRRRGVAKDAELSMTTFEDQRLHIGFHTNSMSPRILHDLEYLGFSDIPIFVPTKEVLSLAKGMADSTCDNKTVEMIFDDGYIDLAKSTMKSVDSDLEAKINTDPRLNTIIPKLVNLIGGRYQWNDQGPFFQPGSYLEKAPSNRSKAKAALMYQDSTTMKFVPLKKETYSSGMTAEGFRKIGILHRLICNGTLLPGTTGPLLWDEPESNLNPKLMKQIVETLLEFSRNSQQVIVGTHDFVLLKWLDLLANKGLGDHIRYHLLYREKGSNEIRIQTSDDYSTVSSSTISNTYAELYDEDVKRALG